MNGEVDDPFPVEDCLFEETFSNDSVYNICGQELRIKQVFGANLGVAAPVWEAAIQLSNYLVEQSVELKGRRVIELGAGTGFLGIFAARLGAVVTLTDLPIALPPLQANVSANMPPGGWTSAPSVLPLSWGTDHLTFSSDWDLVLGADLIYLPETFLLLVETLVHLCHSGTVVFFCSKMRTEHKTEEFYEEYLPTRFRVELVQRDELQNINIYKATLRT
ncbi:EEF1A lysine methyltransferase 3 [Boleophthalmus pectinirostris]|uniref:EEF1A lysine methyltransferase 3 n=1 Tax=Boleophthalmus pectinirostris TaxID=150288 RepID=UPI000A1C7553|nr:EEF1A lysine methyltransferase 3 [Boleophthalmus pectinirostris]